MIPPNKTYLETREVSQLLKIPPSTLRYWENEFTQLRPLRAPTGRRKYQAQDIALIRHIQDLLQVKGYSLTYAKQMLNSSTRPHPPRMPLQCSTPEAAVMLLEQAKARIADPHAVARIDAVARYIQAQ